MAVSRKQKVTRRAADAKATRKVNSVRKNKERARRDARMLEVIKAGSAPYTPDVMSWLSRKLDKPSAKITPADIASLPR